MNLFILHLSPRLAALYYFDSHVIKIILEAVQLLFTAKLILDPQYDYSDAPKRYKPTHANHPVAVWVRRSKENWDWTCELVVALMDEWHYRYQHMKVHGCEPVYRWLTTHPPPMSVLPRVTRKLPPETPDDSHGATYIKICGQAVSIKPSWIDKSKTAGKKIRLAKWKEQHLFETTCDSWVREICEQNMH